MPNLILTRRIGETIHIGDNIEVTMIGMRGNQVRVSIRAPQDVHILRAELKQRIDHVPEPSDPIEPTTPPVHYRKKRLA